MAVMREMPIAQVESGHRTPASSGGLGLVDLIRLLRRRWLVILVVPLVLVSLIALLEARKPPRYRAMATLVVVPPTFSSELKPAEISVQGYQRILESDSVVIESLTRLVEMEVVDESAIPRVGDELTSRIYISRRGMEKSLAPVLEVIAEAGTPEKAATIANTWAEVFLERARLLVEVSLGPSLRLIGTHYQEETGSMAELERSRISTASGFHTRLTKLFDTWDRRLVAVREKWDKKILEHRAETEDLLAEFQQESRRVMGDQAASLFSALGDEGHPRETDPELISALRELLVLRTHLAQTPAIVALEKAITDDALWLRPRNEETGVESDILVTEESDPVYEELAGRISAVESRAFGLMGPGDQELRTALTALEAWQRVRTAGLGKLKLGRAAELEELRQSKGLAIRQAERQRLEEVNALEFDRDTELRALDREIEAAEDLLDHLAQSANQASLAVGEGSLEDIQVASRALPPLVPEPRTLLLRLAMALAVGTILGLALAVLLEANARSRILLENGT
jgi:uncharacterized protein involved in exopolysaccharide biosynthesis